jgi:hypothetical protein
MENKHAHTPESVFNLLGKKSFASLSAEEQQLVIQYLTVEEYEELHTAALFLGKSMLAGSTAAYHPAKTALLQQFDKKHTGPTLFSMTSSLWKIAAVCLLFLSGWLCHYLASHSRTHNAIMAVVDTVYLTPQTVIRYDTVYIEKPAASRQHARPMQERRDATECHSSQVRRYQTGSTDAPPCKVSEGEDSLNTPMTI